MSTIFAVAFMTLFAVLSGISPASALVSAWSDGHGASVRLVSSGQRSDDGAMLAGIEFDLAPGWKTYWRHPGEAGIPPKFDFERSEGVGHVEVLYPAPSRYADKYGNSIVYDADVVLPVKIWPDPSSQTVRMDLSLFVGVCEIICVPFTAQVKLDIPVVGLVNRTIAEAVASALAKVPKTQTLLELQTAQGLSVAIEATTSSGREDISVVSIEGASLSSDLDLFVEATSGAFVPVPNKLSSSAGTVRFEVDLSKLGEGSNRLRLTLVDKSFHAETYVTVNR